MSSRNGIYVFQSRWFFENVIITYSLRIKFLASDSQEIWSRFLYHEMYQKPFFGQEKSQQYKMGPQNSAYRPFTYCLNALSIEIRDILDILITNETLGGSFIPFLDCKSRCLSPFFFEDEFPISVCQKCTEYKRTPSMFWMN